MHFGVCGSRLQTNHWKRVLGRPEVPRQLRSQWCLRAISLRLYWFLFVSSSDPKGAGRGQGEQELTSGLLTGRLSSGHSPPPPCGSSYTSAHPGLLSNMPSLIMKTNRCFLVDCFLYPELEAIAWLPLAEPSQSLDLKRESPRLPPMLSHLGPKAPVQPSLIHSLRTDDGLLGLEQDNKTTACAHRGCTIQVARDLDQEMPVRDFPGGCVTRPHTPNAGDLGLIPGQATRSPILQLKIPHASTKTQCSQIF